MARLFDALGSQESAKSGRKPRKTPVVENVPVQVPPPPASPVSFIEVGIGGIVDASPDVLEYSKPEKVAVPEVIVAQTPAMVPIPSEESHPKVVSVPQAEDSYTHLMGELVSGFPVRKEGILLFVTPPSVYVGESVLKLAEKAASWGEAVLVECRSHGAEITRILGLQKKPGWQELLAGKSELDSVLIHTNIPGLKVIPSGNKVGIREKSPRLITRSPRALVREIRREYRLVLLDGGVWTEEPSTLSLARECDGVCVLVPASKAGSTSVEEMLGRVEDSGCRLAGVMVLPTQDRGQFSSRAA